MKKIINTMNVMLLLVLAFAFTACNEQKSISKVNLNHIAATKQSLVVEVAAGQLIEKSNILNLLPKSRINEIFESAKEQNQEVAARNFLDFKNGAVDYESRIYVIVNPKKEESVVYGNIKNYNKFEEAILNIAEGEDLSSPITFKGDYMIAGADNSNVIYNKERFIITINVDADDLEELIAPKSTLAQMPYANHLAINNVDAVCFGRTEEFLYMYKNIIPSYSTVNIADLLPNSAADKLYIGANLSFEKGGIIAQTIMVPEDSAAKKEIEEYVATAKTTGKFNSYISNNAILAGVQNMNGKLLATKQDDLFRKIEQNPFISNTGLVEKLLQIVGKIDGEIAYAINSLEVSLFGAEADFSIFMEAKDKTIFSDIKNIISETGIGIQTINDNKISIPTPGQKTFIEYKDNYLSISSNEENKTVKSDVTKARYYKGDQDYGFFVLDIKKIVEIPMIQQVLPYLGNEGVELVNLLDYLKFTVPNIWVAQTELRINNTSTNTLEIITKAALTFMD